MSVHPHRCPHCGNEWSCSSQHCEAPQVHACPGCFCSEIERIGAAELARVELRWDLLVWTVGAMASLLILFAAYAVRA